MKEINLENSHKIPNVMIDLSKFMDGQTARREKVEGSGKKKGGHNGVHPIRNPEHLRLLRRYFHDKYERTTNINMKKKHLRNHLIFMVGINTLLRISDILRLTWNDLLSEKFYIKEKKTDKWNYKFVNDDLKTHVDEYFKFCEKYGFNTDGDYAPFVGKYKSEISLGNDSVCISAAKTYIKVLKEAARKIGITDNIGTHTMRKTYCYWFLMNNKNNYSAIDYLQQELNHDKRKTTLGYAGISEDTRHENTDDIGNFYKSVDKGEFSVCPDKISLSETKIKDLIKQAYILGTENADSPSKTLEDMDFLMERFEKIKL